MPDTKNVDVYKRDRSSVSPDIEEIGRVIVDAAYKVHSTLGPGLLESAYQACLAQELTRRGLKVVCEVILPVIYEGMTIEAGYRIDMLVEDRIIIENKAADQVLPIHQAQLLTYLRLKGCWLGYLINWNVKLIKDGIQRIVNGKRPV
jgi:GxxExxY protein